LREAMIKLYPPIEEVFVDDFEGNGKHFMPIASIDLAEVDKSLAGKIHLVYFNNDPYCEVSYKSFNEFCDDSKVSFDIVNDKYKFKTDFGYFATNSDWLQWMERGRISFKENSLKYALEQNIDISEVIKNLGGSPEWVQSKDWPTNQRRKGLLFRRKKLLFICQVWSGDFVSDNCEEEIFLFYDKENKRAVQIHQID
jgi:hypothetical protein